MIHEKDMLLPALTKDLKGAVLVAWLKEPGEAFAVGESLYEVEADKVVHQVEATENGVLTERLVEEGDAVHVGDVLAHWKG